MLIEAAPEIRGKPTTPAASYLAETNQHCPKSTEDEAQFFHYLAAKMLFLCKRRCLEIQTAIEFLSTKVKDPIGNDLKNLGQVTNSL
jgi:hypothetical protein